LLFDLEQSDGRVDGGNVPVASWLANRQALVLFKKLAKHQGEARLARDDALEMLKFFVPGGCHPCFGERLDEQGPCWESSFKSFWL
jgi:hypothetical protein